jgi:hypothetical protein
MRAEAVIGLARREPNYHCLSKTVPPILHWSILFELSEDYREKLFIGPQRPAEAANLFTPYQSILALDM